jgi:hypothetical protein
VKAEVLRWEADLHAITSFFLLNYFARRFMLPAVIPVSEFTPFGQKEKVSMTLYDKPNLKCGNFIDGLKNSEY